MRSGAGEPRRLLLALAALSLLILSSLVFPDRAYACSCAGITTRRAAAQADAIFSGTVTSVQEIGWRSARRAEIRFAVSRVYKGDVYATQLVSSDPDSASCGLAPQVGSAWVIFATDTIDGDGDDAVRRLRTTLCSGNLPSAIPPVLLGRGVEPRPGESDREERAQTTDERLTRGLVIAGVGVTGLLVLIGAGLIYLWRPRPR